MLSSRPTDVGRAADIGQTVFEGRYSDGRTAVSHQVKVTFVDQQLVISGAGPQLRWPVRGLESAEYISRKSKDVMLHEPGRKGGTLYVADQRFLALLAARAPSVTAWSRRWMGFGTFFWLAATTAVIAALVYITDFSPARSVARLLPHDTRAMLGREVVRSMSGGRRVCTQPAGKAALDVLTKRLSDATGRTATFSISVIDSEVMNAFAAPGEQIVILRKLLETAGSPDEVAGVLAHEMGHGLELHPESGIIRSVGLMAITEIMLGGSGGGLANIGLYLTQLGYTRQAERQADGHAIAILKRSGIATQGMMDFFGRIAKMTGEERGKAGKTASPSMDILRTHPSIAERMAVFAAQPVYPATPALTADEWQALRSICRTTSDAAPAPARPGPRSKKPERGTDNGRDI